MEELIIEEIRENRMEIKKILEMQCKHEIECNEKINQVKVSLAKLTAICIGSGAVGSGIAQLMNLV